MAREGRAVTWREAIDWAVREYRMNLDMLKECDRKAEELARAGAAGRAESP